VGWRRRQVTVRGDGTVVNVRWLALLVALALAAGCGNDDADGASETGTTSTTESDAEPGEGDVDAKLDEVLDALVAAEVAVCEALGSPTPDADHPELLATHTGPVLDRTVELAEEFRDEGLAFQCSEDSRLDIEVLSFEFGEFDDDEAVWLELCVVDDSERVVVETGEVVGGGLTAARVSDALRRVDGEWKLAERRVNEEWEGADECAVD
jgi:hypothetical protein